MTQKQRGAAVELSSRVQLAIPLRYRIRLEELARENNSSLSLEVRKAIAAYFKQLDNQNV